MINSKKELNDILRKEEEIYKPGIKKFSPFDIDEFQIIWKIQRYLRLTEYAVNTQSILAVYYKIRLKRLQCKYGLHIPLNVCGGVKHSTSWPYRY